MAAPKMLLPALAWDERFRVENAEDLMTPALLLYPDAVGANIDAIVKSLSGDASRWRAHVKTAKLAFTMRMLVERGVTDHLPSGDDPDEGAHRADDLHQPGR